MSNQTEETVVDLVRRLRATWRTTNSDVTDAANKLEQQAHEIERLTREIAEVQRMRNSELYPQPEASPVVAPAGFFYMQCEKHRLVPYSFTVRTATVPLKTICPICEPPT